MKKVLIIGGKSALGIELSSYLKSYYEVITAGRSECDIYLDLEVSPNLNIDIKCDVVILTAAAFSGNDLNELENTVNVNVVGAVRAISIANKIGAKHFVLISSMSVTQEKTSPYYGIYSITKRQAEEVAEFVCASIKMSLTILRPTQLYSQNGLFKRHQPLIYSIINSVNNHNDIIFYGKKNAIRNYLHVDDLNEIIRNVIELMVVGKFNCVNIKSTSLIAVANAAICAFKSSTKYSFDETKDDICDNDFEVDSEFYKKIDFEPRIDIELGMRMMANSIIRK